jgi:hypothetical protein
MFIHRILRAKYKTYPRNRSRNRIVSNRFYCTWLHEGGRVCNERLIMKDEMEEIVK